MDRSTIAAIATPIGSAGIGIIRISGKDAFAIASTIFRKSAKDRSAISCPEDSFDSHRLYHGYIVDPENGRLLDEVLLSMMKAPHSYTCEDVVEINSHSGAVILKNLLALVVEAGARLAEPGEFSRRAYLNGRIDLTQAEAIMDIITARTDKSLETAAAHLAGEFGSLIMALREDLLQVVAAIEAAIDFPEAADEAADASLLVDTLERRILAPLKRLVERYQQGHILRDGLVLAVVGKPNVGKSSLMNRLLEKERVIVSSVPGTTRDFIEETANINGIPIIIADTAGLHETDDPVEVMGIQKTREYIDSADLILFVVDASGPLSAADGLIFEAIQTKKTLLVQNKSDLIKNDFRLDLPTSWKNLPGVIVSARHDENLDRLKDLIADVSIKDFKLDAGNHILPNLRQKLELDNCLNAVVTARDGLKKGNPAELVAIDIEQALTALDNIVGLTVKTDILDHIFNQFCIGK